jgi:hypothetical protein
MRKMMMRMHLRVSSPLFSSVFHPSSTLVSSVFFSNLRFETNFPQIPHLLPPRPEVRHQVVGGKIQSGRVENYTKIGNFTFEK